MRLESFQENLGRMASAPRLSDHLAFHTTGRGGHRARGRPSRAPRLPHWRLHIYPRQPLDILRSFTLYHLWTERCRKNFDDQYSLKAVLTQAWVATVEVGMASWKAIRSYQLTKDPEIQASIELDFRREWLHMNILGIDHATIRWHFLPPLYYLNFSND
jgi:hypothetical protein